MIEMNKPVFIWDLDGTLLDSYDVIVTSLKTIYLEQGIELDEKEILKEVISESVASFIAKMEREHGINFEDLREHYIEISRTKIMTIKAIKHAKELLTYLNSHGVSNYVYTHRGITTETILKNIDLYDEFIEIVTNLNHFKRKPDPEGLNYLVNKYHLDKDDTYYVGDRIIDIECASNAGIKSILYLPEPYIISPSGKESYVINDLLEIEKLL